MSFWSPIRRCRCFPWLFAWAVVAPVTGVLAGEEPGQVVKAGQETLAQWPEGADPEGRSGLLVRVGMALMGLGHYREAEGRLKMAVRVAEGTETRADDAAALAALGDLHLASHRLEESLATLQQGEEAAREVGEPRLLASVLNNLANGRALSRDADRAETLYAESLELAERDGGDPLLVARILSNRARSRLRGAEPDRAWPAFQEAVAAVSSVGDASDRAFLLANLGKSGADFYRRMGPRDGEVALLAVESLNQATSEARLRGDGRLLSFAKGTLGRLYEESGRLEEALRLTREALFHAQSVMDAEELLYQWQWQEGRLLVRAGKTSEAMASYRAAIATLARVRSGLLTGARDQGKSFRETIGPLYHELADLLLTRAKQEQDPRQREDLLVSAREAVEGFKVAEIQELFLDECVLALRSQETTLDQVVREKTAILYPIMLPDRLELLVTLPGGMTWATVPIAAAALEREAVALRQDVETGAGEAFLPHAQRLYDLLIAPLRKELLAAGVETLVFVPDGELRGMPLAALHDGKRFLVEDFAVAITPGLTLIAPKPMDRGSIRILVAALSSAVDGFPPLPNVPSEVEKIRALFPTEVLAEEAFSLSGTMAALAGTPYPIVHIASHGQFDPDPDKSFLLAWDGKLTLDLLADMIGAGRFRQQPVELLTLSACQTAVGNDLAALGLAGMAIKSGARSALASLWFIDDAATSRLVAEFYAQLKNPEVSKARALRNAQSLLLKDGLHPGLWSAFILIGNWL